jgi:hypothetical protein
MIESHNALHTLRRESVGTQQEAMTVSDLTECLLEHEEPEWPIHPGLEFEILENFAADAANSKHVSRNDAKLLLSFVCLVISGSGNVIASKLQAIPM